MDTSTAPSLFIQPGTASYASVAWAHYIHLAADVRASQKSTQQVEEEAIEALRTSKGRRRGIPSPSGSDDKQGAGPSKMPAAPETSTSAQETGTTTHEPQRSRSPPAGLRHFVVALQAPGE